MILFSELSDAQKINSVTDGRVFRVKSDINSVFMENGKNELLFKKGESIRIWVESSSDWIRVKGYGAKELREQARGKTILYLFNQDLPDQTNREKLVKEKIVEILQVVDGAPL